MMWNEVEVGVKNENEISRQDADFIFRWLQSVKRKKKIFKQATCQFATEENSRMGYQNLDTKQLSISLTGVFCSYVPDI